MTHNTLIVSNWKMNLNFPKAKKLVENICKIKFDKSKLLHVICPQNLLLPVLNENFENKNFIIGSQDFHHETNGAFTGDTSIELLKHFKCDYSILGHSERRKFHSETNQIIKKKINLAIKSSIIPILCVGESLNKRKENCYFQFIEKQLKECVSDEINELIVAYEPIWSIGTGITPLLEEIQEVVSKIQIFLEKKNIKNYKILYGGSVDTNNFENIMSIKNLNGALIGGASLKIEEMNKILTTC